MIKKFKNLKLKNQIIIGCLLPITIFISISLYNYFMLDRMSEIPLKMYKHPFAVSNSVRDIGSNLSNIQKNLLLISSTKENNQKFIDDISESEQNIEKSFILIQERFLGDKKKILQAEKNFSTWRGVVKDIINLADNNERAKAISIIQESSLVYEQQIFESISYLLDFADNKGMEFNRLAKSTRDDLMRNNIYLLSLSCILSFVILGLILKSINIQLAQVVKYLTDVLRESKSCSTQLDISSESLLETANHQSASLEHSASSLQSISTMINENAESAVKSTVLSKNCQEASLEGKSAVEKMQDAIASIEKSHEGIVSQFEKGEIALNDISNIIKTIEDKSKIINDIVFQTKLLSFNASVEAARAGENGKGFAVVAEEIGNLAKMTGQTADEITTLVKSSSETVLEMIEVSNRDSSHLIEESKEKVKFGRDTSFDCEKALARIESDVKNVDEILKSISKACNNQSKGVKEITDSFSVLSQISDKNSQSAKNNILVSQSVASSSDELNKAVILLQKIVHGEKKKKSLELVKGNVKQYQDVEFSTSVFKKSS